MWMVLCILLGELCWDWLQPSPPPWTVLIYRRRVNEREKDWQSPIEARWHLTFANYHSRNVGHFWYLKSNSFQNVCLMWRHTLYRPTLLLSQQQVFSQHPFIPPQDLFFFSFLFLLPLTFPELNEKLLAGDSIICEMMFSIFSCPGQN